MQARDTQITEAGFGFSDEICEWKSVCLSVCLRFATNTINFVFNIKKIKVERHKALHITIVERTTSVTYRQIARLTGLINLITQP